MAEVVTRESKDDASLSCSKSDIPNGGSASSAFMSMSKAAAALLFTEREVFCASASAGIVLAVVRLAVEAEKVRFF